MPIDFANKFENNFGINDKNNFESELSIYKIAAGTGNFG
jgi:hypothetical protein